MEKPFSVKVLLCVWLCIDNGHRKLEKREKFSFLFPTFSCRLVFFLVRFSCGYFFLILFCFVFECYWTLYRQNDIIGLVYVYTIHAYKFFCPVYRSFYRKVNHCIFFIIQIFILHFYF